MAPWKAVAAGGAVFGGIVAVLLATRKSAPTAQRVALIGDSYAVGLGPELQKLLPGLQFEGHVGISTAGWLAGNHDWLTTFAPDVVLVSLGVNDGANPNSANYQAIVQQLHGIGAHVVWIEPPAGVNAPGVRAIIASLGVTTVPATTTPLAGDGLHPASYSQWAREVAATMRVAYGFF